MHLKMVEVLGTVHTHIFNITIGRAACETRSATRNLGKTQHLLWDQGKPPKTLIELAGRRTFRMQTDF
jgi:hypothetical protein